MIITLDTEYSARYQETGVAPLSCLAYALESDPDDVRIVLREEAVELWLKWIRDPDVVLLGHSIANDVAVLSQAANPGVRPGDGWAWELAFAAYDAGRIRCTEIRQRLLGIAFDDVTKDDATLSTLMRHHFGEDMSAGKKASDEANLLLRDAVPYLEWPSELLTSTPWRFKFETLAEVPLESWPADALEYVRSDAAAPLRIFRKQSEIAGGDWIVNERVRTRAAFDLQLVSIPGWLTDRPRVQGLIKLYTRLIEECTVVTIEAGITREKTFWAKKPEHPGHRTERSTKVKFLQQLIYLALGADTPLSKAARKRGFQPRTPEEHLANASRDSGAVEKAIVARGGTPLKFVDAIKQSVDGDIGAWLASSGDPGLNAHRIRSKAEKLVSAFLSNFDTNKRVRSSYRCLVATGRTSTRGSKSTYGVSVQQQPTDRDKPAEYQTRGCIVPDEDEIIVGSDYGQLELCSLGHLLSVVGRQHTGDPDYESTLARAINEGQDCHVRVAAGLEGLSIERALELRATKDEDFDLVRKLAKAVNFGLPGGMGWRSFVDFALTAYGLVITPEKAKQARELWMDTWLEIPWYFGMIRDAVNLGGGRANITQLYSNRVRGNCFYTASCNSLFQGLAADGAMEALRLITDASYRGVVTLRDYAQRLLDAKPVVTKAAATLKRLRFRPIAFVHDEFVGAQPDPLLFLRDDLGYSKSERWSAYEHAKKQAARRCEDEFDAMIIERAEEGLNALSTLMIEGMRVYIPDVAIRTDGKIFHERWGK